MPVVGEGHAIIHVISLTRRGLENVICFLTVTAYILSICQVNKSLNSCVCVCVCVCVYVGAYVCVCMSIYRSRAHTQATHAPLLLVKVKHFQAYLS